MIESQEPKTTEQPTWFNLPEKSEYWTCFGRDILKPQKKRWPWQKQPKEGEMWVQLFYSQEDAEANASLPKRTWEWDGKPAVQVSLSFAIREARIGKNKGVAVKSFRDGAWHTVKRYLVGVPLPEEERGE